MISRLQHRARLANAYLDHYHRILANEHLCERAGWNMKSGSLTLLDRPTRPSHEPKHQTTSTRRKGCEPAVQRRDPLRVLREWAFACFPAPQCLLNTQVLLDRNRESKAVHHCAATPLPEIWRHSMRSVA